MQQKLFRSAISIREEKNGYYTVYASNRWEHKDIGSSTEYPNLSWAEVSDLVLALLEEWSQSRTAEHQVVLPSLWHQLSLLPDA